MSRSWKALKISAKTQEAEGVTSFELVDPDGASLHPFNAGSHLDVEVTPGLIRQYSLCNNPQETHRYLIGVLRETASRGGSATLVDTIKAGSIIRVSEPRNHFALDPLAQRVLLLAGGIGITPILCMAEHLATTMIPFELHYVVRSRERAAFYERLSGSDFSDRVQFHFNDEAGKPTVDLVKILKTFGQQDHLYVCGPKGFIDAVLNKAVTAGWPVEHLHREFFAAAEDIVHAGDEAFEVEIASTGVRLNVPADKSVVDVLLENGLDIPVSCEQGVCGTCVTRILQGEPDHRDMFMTEQEHARSDQFTPCCSRSKSKLLVLDL